MQDWNLWISPSTADPIVRPKYNNEEFTIILALGRNFFYPTVVKGKGAQLPLKKKGFFCQYPRLLTVVDKISNYADGVEQFECWQYTINHPGKILIYSKDRIKVIGKEGNEVEEIQAPNCHFKAYREAGKEHDKPVFKEVANATGPTPSVEDPVVRPEDPNGSFDILQRHSRTLFHPLEVSGRGAKTPLLKPHALQQTNYPRVLTVVSGVRKYDDDGKIGQYQCCEYTINKPGEIVICSSKKIKVMQGEKVVEELEAPNCLLVVCPS